MSIRFVDELDGCFGWTESATLRRTSHALAVHPKQPSSSSTKRMLIRPG